MSAPNTDIEKQVRRHSPSLFGISLAVAAAAAIGIAITLWNEEIDEGNTGQSLEEASVETERS